MSEDKKKKEITVDFDLYREELNSALNQGVSAGYTQALQSVIRYIKAGTPAKDFFTSEAHELWKYVLEALGKGNEWEEYLKAKQEKEEQKESKEG